MHFDPTLTHLILREAYERDALTIHIKELKKQLAELG